MRQVGPDAHRDGREFLRRPGLAEEVLEVAEMANPEVNWVTLVWALDVIFLGYGGTSAQAAFLRAPQTELGGATAAEVLARPGGFEEVCEAARRHGRHGLLL